MLDVNFVILDGQSEEENGLPLEQMVDFLIFGVGFSENLNVLDIEIIAENGCFENRNKNVALVFGNELVLLFEKEARIVKNSP